MSYCLFFVVIVIELIDYWSFIVFIVVELSSIDCCFIKVNQQFARVFYLFRKECLLRMGLNMLTTLGFICYLRHSIQTLKILRLLFCCLNCNVCEDWLLI
jgi:hypothetical protein